jgi:hypothetical protein
MKPKTRIQQEVTRLSKRLPRLTEEQKAYAFRHCFKHYAIKRANGTNICTECGHSWKSGHDLADTICGCTCPHCGMELEVLRTRKSTFSDMEYFSIVTTCKHYQVIRFFSVKSRYKAGQPAEYSICEVVQRWITPDGKATTIARLRGMSQLYYDLWNEHSDMEVRKNGGLRAYDIDPICTYPRQRFIPELKCNGFNGEYHKILPYDLFKAILSDSRAETLLKAGQYTMLRYCMHRSLNIGEYWASVKICIRNGYTIPDGSMWRDYIDLLQHFGKDTNSPKYVCPQDLKAEHDKWVKKRNRQREREHTEQQRIKAIEDEKEYLKAKGIFFGLVFTDSLICVKVIESVEEMILEGKAMHHCVGGYHRRKDSLIFSATINGKRIETVEVSLKTLQVVQSRGVCNSNTEYHDRIITLVENNAELIRKRMKEAA